MAEEKAADKKKKEANAKIPSALKRDIQSEQRRLRNRSYRSSLNTAVRNFETALSKLRATNYRVSQEIVEQVRVLVRGQAGR